jgi:hypothetical protein
LNLTKPTLALFGDGGLYDKLVTQHNALDTSAMPAGVFQNNVSALGWEVSSPIFQHNGEDHYLSVGVDYLCGGQQNPWGVTAIGYYWETGGGPPEQGYWVETLVLYRTGDDGNQIVRASTCGVFDISAFGYDFTGGLNNNDCCKCVNGDCSPEAPDSEGSCCPSSIAVTIANHGDLDGTYAVPRLDTGEGYQTVIGADPYISVGAYSIHVSSGQASFITGYPADPTVCCPMDTAWELDDWGGDDGGADPTVVIG